MWFGHTDSREEWMGKDKKDTGQERTQEPFNGRGPLLQKDKQKTQNETGNDSTCPSSKCVPIKQSNSIFNHVWEKFHYQKDMKKKIIRPTHHCYITFSLRNKKSHISTRPSTVRSVARFSQITHGNSRYNYIYPLQLTACWPSLRAPKYIGLLQR